MGGKKHNLLGVYNIIALNIIKCSYCSVTGVQMEIHDSGLVSEWSTWQGGGGIQRRTLGLEKARKDKKMDA